MTGTGSIEINCTCDAYRILFESAQVDSSVKELTCCHCHFMKDVFDKVV